MPRSSRRSAPARPAPSRPTVAPNRNAPTPGQQRPSSTAAHPQAGAQQQQSGGSGLFGQMAATAGGVAIGSSIGHAIGGLFGGGSNQAAEQQDPALASSQQQTYNTNSSGYSAGCEESARSFTKCLDENKGEYQMSVCSWYLDQLKACQAAAKQY